MELLEFIYRLLYGLYEEIRFRLYYGPVFHRFLNHKYPYYNGFPPTPSPGFSGSCVIILNIFGLSRATACA